MAQPEIVVAQEAWRKIVTRAWTDEKFRYALVDNPSKVLAENGYPVKPGVHFVVVENEPNRVHLVLPAKPDAAAAVQEPNAEALSWYDAANH